MNRIQARRNASSDHGRNISVRELRKLAAKKNKGKHDSTKSAKKKKKIEADSSNDDGEMALSDDRDTENFDMKNSQAIKDDDSSVDRQKILEGEQRQQQQQQDSNREDWNETATLNEKSEQNTSNGEKTKENCDNKNDCDATNDNSSDNLYKLTDKGPYVVHLASKKDSDDNMTQDLHDVDIGLKLKQMKTKGIWEIKKVTRKELKIIFGSKEEANWFLKGNQPNLLGVNAFIPRYNVVKVGIVFDIPTLYSEEYLKENLTAEVPIMEVRRCQKRKVLNGRKTQEWIPANTVKLTFRGQAVPDEVIFGFSKRKVKPDVPQPIQCFKCLRFGHMAKFCRQEGNTCQRCGTRHEFSRENPCSNGMKCFHCHSDKHDGCSRDCPEFLRNKLIKEAMFFDNITFGEADERFPKTQSQYRIAERRGEFPELRQKNHTKNQEPKEKSFARKSAQELSKDYATYVQLNQGKVPAEDSTKEGAMLYSETVRGNNRESPIKEKSLIQDNMKKKNPELKEGTERKKTDPNNDRAIAFIKDLAYKLDLRRLDPDQGSGHSLSNDLLLIDIGRMVMSFLQVAERPEIPYAGVRILDSDEEV